jgi:hypothetical protein
MPDYVSRRARLRKRRQRPTPQTRDGRHPLAAAIHPRLAAREASV